MLYVGMDIHSKHISMCVLNQDGKIVERRKVRQMDQMMTLLEGLPERFEVCFEASCGYGRFHESFHPLASRVVVAHPGRLQMIFRSKRKNDRNDAEHLAKLLLLGIVPAVHVPSADVRAWRETITFRRRLIEKRTRAKNGIRALLRTVGATPPTGLWTRDGVRWLQALEFPHLLQALKRDMLLDELQRLSAQVRRVEKELARFSAGPYVQQSPTIGTDEGHHTWRLDRRACAVDQAVVRRPCPSGEADELFEFRRHRHRAQ